MPKTNSDIYLGIMSGTSLDGIDIAIIDFAKNLLIASEFYPYPTRLKNKIINKKKLRQLHIELGHIYADCINDCIHKSGLDKARIRAIGLHGQTINHQPHGQHPYSLQIGDGNIVAYKTAITTVADFRNKDIIAGGEGAPLTPIFHEFLFRNTRQNIGVLNIGGIANLTILPGDYAQSVTGFDTGPGNCLADDWVRKNHNKDYDANGTWGQRGKVKNELLEQMLADPYFVKHPPKSTGREYFNLKWLEKFNLKSLKPEDVQATIYALSVSSIAQSVNNKKINELIVCGGGVHNDFLLKLIQNKLSASKLKVTEDYGYDPDFIEACAFAYLAKLSIEGKPGNLPTVTGAREPVILGAIFQGKL